MMSLHEMIEYLVDFEFRGSRLQIHLWAANPDAVMDLMLGDQGLGSRLVKVFSIKRVKK